MSQIGDGIASWNRDREATTSVTLAHIRRRRWDAMWDRILRRDARRGTTTAAVALGSLHIGDTLEIRGYGYQVVDVKNRSFFP